MNSAFQKEIFMTESDPVAFVPLTFSEIRTLRGLLLDGLTEVARISQGDKERLAVKLHAALEGVVPLTIGSDVVQ
jgi:hypothetical protein